MAKEKCVLGIDPGAFGAIALLRLKDLELLALCPTEKGMAHCNTALVHKGFAGKIESFSRSRTKPQSYESNIKRLADYISTVTEYYDVVSASIEAVTVVPRQANAKQLVINQNSVRVILLMNDISVNEMQPNTWKVNMNLTKAQLNPSNPAAVGKMDMKTASREEAKRRFPAFSTVFDLVTNDGYAEAALLAKVAASGVKFRDGEVV